MKTDTSATVRKLILLPLDINQEVEDFRFDNRIKSESEALRILIRRGLDAGDGTSHEKIQQD